MMMVDESYSTKKPLVSFVIVVYNSLPYLKETLSSIFSQTFTDYEIVVIDGGSDDGTIEYLKENDELIRFWISEPDRGIYDAMNKGIKNSRGKYLNFLNAGDFLAENGSLEKIFSDKQVIERDYDLIYTDKYNIDPDKSNKNYYKAGEFSEINLIKRGTSIICHQAIYMRRSMTPLYDTRYRFKGELNWYFEILKQNNDLRVLHRKIPAIYYRKGGYGQQKYFKNVIEWIMLIIRRFGVRALVKEGALAWIWKTMEYRYPFCMAIGKFFRMFRIKL